MSTRKSRQQQQKPIYVPRTSTQPDVPKMQQSTESQETQELKEIQDRQRREKQKELRQLLRSNNKHIVRMFNNNYCKFSAVTADNRTAISILLNHNNINRCILIHNAFRYNHPFNHLNFQFSIIGNLHLLHYLNINNLTICISNHNHNTYCKQQQKWRTAIT